MLLKKLGWEQFKKLLLVKMQRLPIGTFAFVFEDSINNCILHEYIAPLRPWERWELDMVYAIFRMQLKEMIE
jgi:hypothetical protein